MGSTSTILLHTSILIFFDNCKTFDLQGTPPPPPSAALRAGGRELFDIHFTTITGTILLTGGNLHDIALGPAKSDSGTSHIGNYMH